MSFDEEPDADPHGECLEEIRKLQRALAFWMPMVPAAAFPAADRLAEDSFLLAGYQGDFEKDAEALGWVQLMCPHGMPWAQNICGPCSEGRPNLRPPTSGDV